jgi:two-component system sensor histidine kinase MtrB
MNDSRISPVRQIGLRARLIMMFTFAALLVALGVTAAAAALSRNNLLAVREDQLTARVRANGVLMADRLTEESRDPQLLFGSLTVAGKPSVLIVDPAAAPLGYRPISLDTKYGANEIPEVLRTTLEANHTIAIMRYRRETETLVTAGVPLADGQGFYFETASLNDIDRSLSGLSRTLTFASIGIAGLGAAVGFWTSRRVLRPLADIATVAESVSVGKLDARLAYAEWAEDPDLAPLLRSFNEMFATLQDRIDRDARFASDVSHELRSPLTTFSASLEVLRNARDELPDRAQIALDLLSSDMERFTQLVEDLLEISRYDAGAVRLDLTDVMITEVVQMTVRALKGNTIRVEFEPEVEGLIVQCDKRRVARVISNFIDNADKYGDGVVRVSVERHSLEEENPEAATSSIGLREVIWIAVEDAGPGVPEAERDNIFDRFSRGAQGGSRGSDRGVGLGLALAAEHAALQYGRVWVEDRAGGEPGARFVLELPFRTTEDDLDTTEKEAE